MADKIWKSRENTSVETADVEGLLDPLAAGIDAATGTAYVLLREKLKIVPPTGKASEVSVKTEGIEGFFTPTSGSRCPMVATGGRLLLVDKESLIVVDAKTGESRVVKDSKWCLCANDGDTIYLADKGGAVHRAEYGLSHVSFPGSFTLVQDFKGEYKEMDINDLYANDDFLKSQFKEEKPIMRLRDSGSSLAALWAGSKGLFISKGNGLARAELPGGGNVTEILKEQRSSASFPFASALYAVGSSVFAQCADGIRQVPISGGPVVLKLKAGDMVFDDDNGSPEPYPKDVVGYDSKYIYFMVERDFYSGMALRRWPHGCKGGNEHGSVTEVHMDPAPEGASEMKVAAHKSVGFYIRAAVSFLKGVDAKPAEGEKAAVEARAAVKDLRITALGNAADVAVSVAQRMEADGLATISRVQTGYPSMEGSGKGCAQIAIDLKKL